MGGGGGWKNLYILLRWGEGSQTHSYIIFSKSIGYFILEIARSCGLAGIIAIHLRLEGEKKLIVMSWFLLVLILCQTGSFSVTDTFLHFIMFKKEMVSCVRIGGRGLKNLTYPYMGEGIQNCQNHPYVINEWPLTTSNYPLAFKA